MLTVVSAAVRLCNGLIISLPRPARHHNIVHALHNVGVVQGVYHDLDGQGFVLSDGSFATREEARQVAKDAGQLLKSAIRSADLFSEDVW